MVNLVNAETLIYAIGRNSENAPKRQVTAL